jgi:hypothetical protein
LGEDSAGWKHIAAMTKGLKGGATGCQKPKRLRAIRRRGDW